MPGPKSRTVTRTSGAPSPEATWLSEIVGAARLAGRDRLAQRGDDLRRAQRELGEFVLAQRWRELGRRRIEMNDAAGAVEQHGRVRHAGNDRADGSRFNRTD